MKKGNDCTEFAKEAGFGKKMMIAIDANMLLAIGQFKVDVFSEIEKMFGKNAAVVVPMQVFDEVLALGKGKEKKAAGIALEEIKSRGVKIVSVNADGGADNALVEMAKEGCIVASNDAGLRKRIKGFAGKVIYLRQKRFLKIE